jgi:hypothetical protein
MIHAGLPEGHGRYCFDHDIYVVPAYEDGGWRLSMKFMNR